MRIKVKKINWLFLIVICVAASLRLYNLSVNPPHLTPDEASLGYNAYSILKTGKDEYGTTLPIIFKSFGDFKPGLYVYTAVPSVVILGLNEFSVRLPSAIAGIIAVISIYYVVDELFKNKRISLISSFVLALSPWHIMFSRGAWEVNLSLTLTLLGILFFLKGLKTIKYIPLSAVFFALTFIAYQGAKLSTGIVLILLVLLYLKKLLNIPAKVYILSLVLTLIIITPILFSFFNGKTGRLTVFSIFSYPRSQEYIGNFLSESGVQFNSLPYHLYYSEAQNFARGIAGRWFNHFSARFLFFEGDWSNPRHSPPYQGVLLLTDIIPLLVGLAVLLKNKVKREYLFFIVWLFLAVLPAVLSRDQVHAVRSYNMVIPITIILSLGVDWILSKKKMISIPATVALYSLGVVYFFSHFLISIIRKAVLFSFK